MRILIVEDDKDVAQLIEEGLASETHATDVCYDGAQGSFLARSHEYDAIVLDYSLPKKNGLEVCKEVRAIGKTTPIIFLSVNDDTELKVTALHEGADDYMAKPFSFSELSARLHALSRRHTQQKNRGKLLSVDDLTYDTTKHIARRAGVELRLTRKESSILEYLMLNSETVVSRAMIMERVWSADSDPFSNTVEAHIRNLRKKLNAGGKPDLIRNIPGRGYMICSVSQ